MAKDKITDYDSVASNNLDVGGISVAEGMLPSGVNNSIRELMSHQKEAFGSGTPLYVDQTNNRVGIGCTPDSTLEIRTATNSSSDTTYLKLSNLGENVGYIDFENGNGNLARITGTKLGAGASANDGILTFSTAFDSVLSERLRILPTGGITFNGDTSTDNALSDYEVGNWTPRLRGSTGEPGTLTTGTGTYTKIGRLVTVTWDFSNVSTTGYTGTLSIDQLTFSPALTYMSGGNVMFNLIATFPTTTSNISCYLTSSSNSIIFYGSENQGGWTGVTHNAGSSGRYSIGSLTYETT